VSAEASGSAISLAAAHAGSESDEKLIPIVIAKAPVVSLTEIFSKNLKELEAERAKAPLDQSVALSAGEPQPMSIVAAPAAAGVPEQPQPTLEKLADDSNITEAATQEELRTPPASGSFIDALAILR
jgi:hypothetical protein